MGCDCGSPPSCGRDPVPRFPRSCPRPRCDAVFRPRVPEGPAEAACLSSTSRKLGGLAEREGRPQDPAALRDRL
ncbi:hypothetical protein IscW_ISCW022888 [Ixodes scapularis]|uniref:Uncharacterized protein n=1 Tax=Ixodes scapularis TaxID=6945 RepID=B7QD59_IXOSC|nr:hypothetical protein IscW_ISCW022888 [Ixodes scapularis]|eukprot:XP_002413473.1 hypothetical protein IscW_ISCW022888 [Ixodes scapularis]